MKLYELLHRKNVKIPVFVASSIPRISEVKPLKADFVALSARLADLKAQVQSMVRNVQNKLKRDDIPKSSPTNHWFSELSGQSLVVKLEEDNSSLAANNGLSTTSALLSNAEIEEFISE